VDKKCNPGFEYNLRLLKYSATRSICDNVHKVSSRVCILGHLFSFLEKWEFAIAIPGYPGRPGVTQHLGRSLQVMHPTSMIFVQASQHVSGSY